MSVIFYQDDHVIEQSDFGNTLVAGQDDTAINFTLPPPSTPGSDVGLVIIAAGAAGFNLSTGDNSSIYGVPTEGNSASIVQYTSLTVKSDQSAWYTSGGSSVTPGLTVTDGETSVSGTTQLLFSGATVSGSTPDATATITGGGGGGLTGFTSSLNTDPPNDSVNASELIASGGTENQDLVLSPLGTGAFTATLADGTGAGGNKRGTAAVDLQSFQPSKNSATQVASGEFAVIGGGAQNTASAFFSIVAGGEDNIAASNFAVVGGGDSNSALGDLCTVAGGGSNSASSIADTVAGGSDNTASGGYSTVAGGQGNTASGFGSYVPGGQSADTRGITGYGAVASRSFSSSGDGQLGKLAIQAQTSDATPTVLTSDLSAASAVNQVILPDNSSFGFHGWILARESGTASSYWKFEGLIERGTGAASVALTTSVIPTLVQQDVGASTWTVSVTADTTNGGLSITGTGAGGASINWIARIETEELIF